MSALSNFRPPAPVIPASSHANDSDLIPADEKPVPFHDRVTTLLGILCADFPNCFKPRGTRGLAPLKIGVRKDIQARKPDIGPVLLRKSLFIYTGSPEYLRAIIAGLSRVDLDGNITQAEITPEEIAHAKQKLASFRERKRAFGKAPPAASQKDTKPKQIPESAAPEDAHPRTDIAREPAPVLAQAASFASHAAAVSPPQWPLLTLSLPNGARRRA